MTLPTYQDLDIGLAAAIADFGKLRDHAEKQFGADFDALLSQVDEFGLAHVVTNTNIPAGLDTVLGDLADAQERVDDALDAREAKARESEPSREPRISIHGEVFRIEQVDADQPTLTREHVEPLSLTEAIAREDGAAQATPIPDHDRGLSRGR